MYVELREQSCSIIENLWCAPVLLDSQKQRYLFELVRRCSDDEFFILRNKNKTFHQKK